MGASTLLATSLIPSALACHAGGASCKRCWRPCWNSISCASARIKVVERRVCGKKEVRVFDSGAKEVETLEKVVEATVTSKVFGAVWRMVTGVAVGGDLPSAGVESRVKVRFWKPVGELKPTEAIGGVG